jgi:hypothetical protein
MPALGRRSRAITKNELPKVRWEHSHVVVDDQRTVRSYCVYVGRARRPYAPTRTSWAITQSTACTRSSAT